MATQHSDSSESDLTGEALDFAHRLFDAARTGSTAELTSAIDQGVPVDLANESGDTFLMLAAYNGHATLVDALIQRGASVNRPNDRGQTPLAGAVFRRHDAVVQTLIAANADPDSGQPTARATATMFGADYFRNS